MKQKKSIGTNWILTLIAGTFLLAGSCTNTPRENAGKKIENGRAQKIQVPAAEAVAALSGKTWLLAGVSSEGGFIPLEPGHATEARVIFLQDGTFEGSTGINIISGSWKSRTKSQTSGNLIIAISGITKLEAPNEIAARFEALLIKQLEQTNAFKTGKDSVQFRNGKDEVLLKFIFSTEPAF